MCDSAYYIENVGMIVLRTCSSDLRMNLRLERNTISTKFDLCHCATKLHHAPWSGRLNQGLRCFGKADIIDAVTTLNTSMKDHFEKNSSVAWLMEL